MSKTILVSLLLAVAACSDGPFTSAPDAGMPSSTGIGIVAAASINSTGTIAVGRGVEVVVHPETGTYIVTLDTPTLAAIPDVTCWEGGAPTARLALDGTITITTQSAALEPEDLHFYLTVVQAVP